jgi:hypothetical protein
MTATVSIVISVIALAIAALSFFVAFERFRLDLYNKRFEIYLRTVRFYQALMKPKEGEEEAFKALQTDFIIASRESQFLFAPNSGIHDLLSKLNRASFKIIGTRETPKEGMPPEFIINATKEFGAAMSLWNSSMEHLEALIAPYLNYHYATALSALIGYAGLFWQRVRRLGGVSRWFANSKNLSDGA